MADCSCGNKAVYFRKHEGQHYCRNCLSYQIEKRFKKTVAVNRLVNANERIAVAVSGGKDSSVLLHLMSKMKEELPLDVIAISVDEGIEGYRNESIVFAENLAVKLGAEHYTCSFEDNLRIDDLPKNEKHCTYCGVFRRLALNKKARELRADKLALGHNMDDEAQSIIMNILNGDMRRFMRLGAFPHSIDEPKMIPRIKPLRDIPEREITAYAVINKIQFYGGECPNSFNNVRRDVQKIINDLELKRPGTKQQIISFYDNIKKNISVEAEIKYCKICGEPSAKEICRACILIERVSKF